MSTPLAGELPGAHWRGFVMKLRRGPAWTGNILQRDILCSKHLRRMRTMPQPGGLGIWDVERKFFSSHQHGSDGSDWSSVGSGHSRQLITARGRAHDSSFLHSRLPGTRPSSPGAAGTRRDASR